MRLQRLDIPDEERVLLQASLYSLGDCTEMETNPADGKEKSLTVFQDIQVLKETEEMLQLLRLAMEQTLDGVAVADLNGLVQFSNPAWARMHGYEIEELIGQPLTLFHTAEQVKTEVEPFNEQVMMQGGHQGEMGHVRRDGTTFPTWMTVVVMQDAEGQPAGLLAVCQDITERKRTEELLRESEERFKSTFEQALSGMLIVGKDGRFLQVNHAICRMLGYSKQELLALNFQKLTHPDDLAKGVEHLRQMLAGEIDVIQEEKRYIHKLGHEFWVQINVAAVHDAQGQVSYFVTQVQDITEQKRNEATLAKRANELQAVAQLSMMASSILEAERLLQEVVDLTKSHFGLYHAHIYLLDEADRKLVLAAGAGNVGRQMEAQGWQISLDQEHSLVARAARSRAAVVANDVQAEPDYLPNPLLPGTRSELAAPLLAGEELLGALDVQSDVVGWFTDEDRGIMTTLASQVAVALQNARSFAEQQRISEMLNERVKELNCLNEIGRAIVEAPEMGELLAWVTERIPPAMRYAEECVAAIEYEGQVYGVPEAVNLPCQMTHALRIGGEVAGRVYIAYRQKREFADEESALLGGIASRVSGYLESRRLLEQVQTALVEVEQSQQFMRLIIDNIPNPIFFIDTNSVYLGCNRAFLEFFGKREEEVVGKSVYDIHDQEHADRYYESDQELFRNPRIVLYEMSLQRDDGSIRELIFNKAPFTGSDGNLAGLVATMVDITGHKQAEQALRRSEAQLSEALNLARLAYWEFDLATQMFTFNDQFYTLYGTTAREQGGYQMPASEFARQFVQPEDTAAVGIEIQRAIETTDPDYTAQFVSRNLSAVGTEMHVLVQIKVAKDAQGRTIRLYGTNQDITERRLAEMERERLLAEVEVAYRQYVRQEWEQFLGKQQEDTWHVEHQSADLMEQQNGGQAGDTTVVPISLRGQSIGSISLQAAASGRHWAEEDLALVETVSEQLALTVENLRLFTETQQRAAREQLARQITDKMRAAPDMDSIIQTGLSELAKALGVSRAYVRLSPQKSKQSAAEEAEMPDIEAIRGQLKHNGHKPPIEQAPGPVKDDGNLSQQKEIE
jgi:PAS domain S-box-containing protein